MKPQKSTLKTTAEETLLIGKTKVSITHSHKLYFPKEQIAKADLIAYYQSIAEYILPHLKNRPLSLNRFPDGIEKDHFYHKDAGENTPKWVKTAAIYSESTDKDVNYIICNNKATLAYLNNLGCIDFNPWNSKLSQLDFPDYLILDLDPSPKNNFEEVMEVAWQIKEIADEIKTAVYCKTSGSTGIHLYIPLGKKYDYEQVKDFAYAFMHRVLKQLPQLTTLERSLKKREPNKIYLDYLQNSYGQTVASAYSVRPTEGAPVSMPLEWKELKRGLVPSDFTIHNAAERIRAKGDLFLPVLQKGVNIVQAMRILA